MKARDGMSRKRSLIFIGGSLDGQLSQPFDGNEWHVRTWADYPNFTPMVPVSGTMIPPAVRAESYRVEAVQTSQGEIELLVVNGLSARDALVRMIERYSTRGI